MKILLIVIIAVIMAVVVYQRKHRRITDRSTGWKNWSGDDQDWYNEMWNL